MQARWRGITGRVDAFVARRALHEQRRLLREYDALIVQVREASVRKKREEWHAAAARIQSVTTGRKQRRKFASMLEARDEQYADAIEFEALRAAIKKECAAMAHGRKQLWAAKLQAAHLIDPTKGAADAPSLLKGQTTEGQLTGDRTTLILQGWGQGPGPDENPAGRPMGLSNMAAPS